MQKKCDIFVENWNSHRIREQKDLHLTIGIPDHIFSFLGSYGGTKDDFQVSVDLLREIAEVSEVLQENQDFLDVLDYKIYTTSKGAKAYQKQEHIFTFKRTIALLVDNFYYYFLPDWKLDFSIQKNFIPKSLNLTKIKNYLGFDLKCSFSRLLS